MKLKESAARKQNFLSLGSNILSAKRSLSRKTSNLPGNISKIDRKQSVRVKKASQINTIINDNASQNISNTSSPRYQKSLKSFTFSKMMDESDKGLM